MFALEAHKRRHIGFALAATLMGIAIFFVGKSTVVTSRDDLARQKLKWPHLSSSFGPIQVLKPIY